jgi:NhaP-type Na+/H+ or K+/H+ antiporter
MIAESWLPDTYVVVLTGLGILIALVTWLPLALRRLPLSLPIVCIGIGIAIFSVPQISLTPLPILYPRLTEHFSELVVIIALMGAGLKIDRPFGWRSWRVTWRLLAITMPLGIVLIAMVAGWGLGFSWPAALLIAACLAPTDPVLAADVQVGPPKTGAEDDVRFGLTSEAGLNDGLAFPFVHLAIALAATTSLDHSALVGWFGYRIVWEIGAGTLGGWLIGRAFGWLTFHVRAETKLAKTGDGLIALAATLVSYGITETIHAYGFLAVFVTALTFRHTHRDHRFQRDMHDVTEQIERLAMMVLLLLFGGALARGLIAHVSWPDVAAALFILLFIRPLAGLCGLIGVDADRGEKLTLAFFGIRGVGSIYYLAFGLNHMTVANAEGMWGLVGLVIFLSVLLHGLTVTPIMRSLDRRQGRDPDAVHAAGIPG